MDTPEPRAVYEQPEGVNVHVEWHDSTVVLGVSGEIDIVTAPQLQEAVQLALQNTPKRMVVDLLGVSFLASAGLAVLAAGAELAGSSTEFRVVAEGPATARPITLTGLSENFSIFPTRAEALAFEAGAPTR